MIDTMPADTFELTIKNCTALSDYFSLLAILLQAPTPEVVENVKEGTVLDDFQSIAHELGFPESNIEQISEKLIQTEKELRLQTNGFETTRREYTRLFAHPKSPQIYPFEGLFTDSEKIKNGEIGSDARMFINPAAMDAERRYLSVGLAGNNEMPADSVTTELEFMSFLYQRLAQAILESNSEEAARIKEQLDAFQTEHILKWIPRFFERCIEESQIDFYRAIGSMGQTCISLLTNP